MLAFEPRCQSLCGFAKLVLATSLLLQNLVTVCLACLIIGQCIAHRSGLAVAHGQEL